MVCVTTVRPLKAMRGYGWMREGDGHWLRLFFSLLLDFHWGMQQPRRKTGGRLRNWSCSPVWLLD